MKSLFVILFVLLSSISYSQSFDVMSFNIRYDNPDDRQNSWTQGNRKQRVAKILQEEKPSILGVQEALHHQLEFLEATLPNHQRVGVGRDDGMQKGEYAAIFFEKDKFTLLDSGHFWLSETPETPSLGWDATCCHRIATWAKLRQGSKIFFVFNTHFDHEGTQAQHESSRLILSKIKEITAGSNADIILMGDFNIVPWHEGIISIKKQLKDTYVAYENIPSGTFTAFNMNEKPKLHIDYIFVSKAVRAKDYRIIDKKIDGLYPSDHFPVKVRVKLSNRKG